METYSSSLVQLPNIDCESMYALFQSSALSHMKDTARLLQRGGSKLQVVVIQGALPLGACAVSLKNANHLYRPTFDLYMKLVGVVFYHMMCNKPISSADSSYGYSQSCVTFVE